MSASARKNGWIDGHCHLADPRWADENVEIEDVIRSAQASGIDAFIQGGVSPEDWAKQLELQSRFTGKIHCTFGLHPWWVAGHSRAECETAFEKLVRMEGSVGVGELGLDLSDRAPAKNLEHQLEWMERQLDFSVSRKLPVVLHIVRAHEQALQLLEKRRPSFGGLVHSFSAGPEEAKRYFDLGLTLSVSGVIARAGYQNLKKAVTTLPLEAWVFESDAPDQPSPRFAGGHNRPQAILEVAREIARIRGDFSAEELLDSSRDRLKKIFGISKT